ncbi:MULTISPECIES: hypothetical protein [unclassified Citrobacter]|uniref:hypothetical protein n=1 Tax=unclassified Citrobacter TaxID=2644389 RepID=UPI00230432BA|nr:MULTISPECIES: hypothetical protein [unclassified Citrobacter]MDA8500759.1 hypothetical protein [Citrobacter sp. Igbk 17]MDA8511582.1 hypothetical protein [Citrobacter sp. Igbk 14]MDA8515638.1 hypothetical protein [Citrobacter sp. Igbk 16]
MKPSYEELEKKCALQQSKLAAINELMNVVEKASDIAKAGIEELQSQNADMAVQLANAESKRRELGTENAHARERHVFIRALAVSILEHSGGRMDWRGAMEDATELLQTVDSVYAITPATDAFLAEVRAQGVERLANAWYAIANETDTGINISDSSRLKYRQRADDAADFANEIRKEAAQ